jgi:hypothetical protein
MKCVAHFDADNCQQFLLLLIFFAAAAYSFKQNK